MQAISAPTGASFFASAWPDDRRLDDGAMITQGLPLANAGEFATTALVTNGNRLVRGFGLSSPIYLPLSGAIDPAWLPQTAEASLASESTVFLVALDARDRTPIETRFVAAQTSMLPANTIIARPVTGFPLRQSTTYALIVRRSDTLGPDRALWQALHDDSAHYRALREWLKRESIDVRDIAAAVVFSTQDVMGELTALRDWAEAQLDPLPTLEYSREGINFWLFQGSYSAPYLLHGEPPYLMAGGELRFDDSGAPIVNKTEQMRLSLCVPKGPPPPGGFPVVMYSHGTGGDYESVIYNTCVDLAARGIASAGIDQVLHGPRGGGAASCLGMGPEYCFFNPLNPIAIRNLPRQTAIDHVRLKKALARVSITTDAHPEGFAVVFDMTKQGFYGHSQGGLTGALYAAIDHDANRSGVVLSGAGGHLTTTVLTRKDPLDFKALAAGPLFLNLPTDEPLDVFHPALAVMQALAEAADPLNYAGAWLSRPEAAKDMYVTGGGIDPYTPYVGTEAMAAAAGIPQLLPNINPAQPFQLRALLPVALPHQGSGYQFFPSGDHFAALTSPAKLQWR